MDRTVCVHGHFYQPPREDPRTGEVDWNARITAECYKPLADLKVYSRISHDFGPTLLSWLEKKQPEVYRAVLESDAESARAFSGHGSAMAQAYNHMILPLANARDKNTQVIWGIRDFEWRFKRKPEGMWLPETAVDVESLDVLARHGIRFTVLAPHQAKRFRFPPTGRWKDAGKEGIDTRRAYEQKLPSGGIQLFFYDGAISQGIAFEGLASDGIRFAGRLEKAFSPEPSGLELVHVATDGETYGHHHKGGDKGLDDALRRIASEESVRLTNYGEFLEKRPAIHQVEAAEKTSWSCSHGVGRWWTDCGCNSGGNPGWNQAWRTPLRNAMDRLRDAAAPKYEEEAGRLLKDPWAARDRYIDLLLDPSPESRRRFMEAQTLRPLNGEEQGRALKLLELQRHLMLMYTSCGWFFDDIGGIEGVLVLRYAGKAIQLAQELLGLDLEGEFRKILSEAASNDPKKGNGQNVYEAAVKG